MDLSPVLVTYTVSSKRDDILGKLMGIALARSMLIVAAEATTYRD